MPNNTVVDKPLPEMQQVSPIKREMRRNLVLAALPSILALSYSATSQPMIPTYQSLEVMALSGATMVGVPVRIQPPVTGGEQYKVDVVFRDCVAINNWVPYPETGAFLSVDKRKVEEWIRDKSRILSFHGGQWLNLDDPKTRFIDAKMNRITSVDEFIRRLREIYRQHPEIERVRPFYRPLFPEEAERLGVEPDAQVAVPCDRSLEKWGQACTDHRDWERRIVGVRVLQMFESAENRRRLGKLLNDPYSVLDADKKKVFPVREQAKRVLGSWDPPRPPGE